MCDSPTSLQTKLPSDCFCWKCLGIFPYTQLLPSSDLKPAQNLYVAFIKMGLWPTFFFFNLAWDYEFCVLFLCPVTLFIFFYRFTNLEKRLSHFASVDCTDSKEPISSSRLEQWHCLLSVDFVTQRLPRDRLQTDSYEAPTSQNFCFSKKKRTKNLFQVPWFCLLARFHVYTRLGVKQSSHRAQNSHHHLVNSQVKDKSDTAPPYPHRVYNKGNNQVWLIKQPFTST